MTRRKAAATSVVTSTPAVSPAAKPKAKAKAKPKPVPVVREQPYTSNLLLTVREAASLLRISERKMYYLLAREIITAIRIERSTRIKRSVIDTYLATLDQVSA